MANDYYAAQTPIGNALRNIAGAFMSGPTPGEQQAAVAKAALMQQQTRESKGKADQLAAQNMAYGNLAKIFAGADMSGQNMPAGGDLATYRDDQGYGALQQAFLTGLQGQLDPKDFGALARQFATQYGLSDEMLYRQNVGNGNFPGLDNGMSIAHQDRIRAANAGYDQQKAIASEHAKPLSESQVKAGYLQGMWPSLSEDERRVVLNAQNPYSETLIQAPDGTLMGYNTNSPGAQAQAVAAPTQGANGVELGPLRGATKFGSDAGSDMTASMKNVAARASALGISIPEAYLVMMVESAKQGDMLGNFDRANPELIAQYNNIMKRAGTGAAAQPLPPGAEVIQ